MTYIYIVSLISIMLIINVFFYYKGCSDGFDLKQKGKIPKIKKDKRDFSELIDLEFEELMNYDGEKQK